MIKDGKPVWSTSGETISARSASHVLRTVAQTMVAIKGMDDNLIPVPSHLRPDPAMVADMMVDVADLIDTLRIEGLKRIVSAAVVERDLHEPSKPRDHGVL